MHTYIHIYLHARIENIHTNTCVDLFTCIYTYTCINKNTYTIHIYMYAFYTYIRIYIYKYTYLTIYIYVRETFGYYDGSGGSNRLKG